MTPPDEAQRGKVTLGYVKDVTAGAVLLDRVSMHARAGTKVGIITSDPESIYVNAALSPDPLRAMPVLTQYVRDATFIGTQPEAMTGFAKGPFKVIPPAQKA